MAFKLKAIFAASIDRGTGQLRLIHALGKSFSSRVKTGEKFRASRLHVHDVRHEPFSRGWTGLSSLATAAKLRPKLTGIRRDDSAGSYLVDMDNGIERVYPYVWLRDNCRCAECYHPSSWQRASCMVDLDPDITPTDASLIEDGRVLRITWPDQHRSDFPAEWLDSHRFSEMDRDMVADPELETWGAELNGKIPSFDFGKILEDGAELYGWLDTLNSKGLALVKGAPTEKGAVRKLAESVGYLKTTNYGETFQVISKHGASSIAFTSNHLGLHTDQLYFNYMPGIQMLHCIKQAKLKGGESQFVDGFNVAEQFRVEFPVAYDILRTQKIDFRDAGADYCSFHLKQRRPVIQYNEHGQFSRIHYNDSVRAPYLTLPVDQIRETYRALKLFQNVMYRPKNLVEHRLAAGEVATFNNGRVLHGRSAYTVTEEGSRHLEGAYFDWDEAHSRMRILRETLFGEERL